MYWRLVEEGKTVKGFVEFDFPGVTSRKCLYIQRTKQLLQAVSDEGEVLVSIVDYHKIEILFDRTCTGQKSLFSE